MAIEYRVDHDRRLVLAAGRGVMTDADVFGYQQSVWSRPDVAGYDEMIDMTAVERIEVPPPERIKALADLSAGMDPPSVSSRFVIAAPTNLAYWLSRVYEGYRGLDERSTKEVVVVRTRAEALAFLGIDADAA